MNSRLKTRRDPDTGKSGTNHCPSYPVHVSLHTELLGSLGMFVRPRHTLLCNHRGYVFASLLLPELYYVVNLNRKN